MRRKLISVLAIAVLAFSTMAGCAGGGGQTGGEADTQNVGALRPQICRQRMV